MNKNKFIAAFMVALIFSLLSNAASAQLSVPLYQCPFSGSPGDQTFRGFYVENYPSSSLGGVVLAFMGVAGPRSITLHARENTFDGALIGSVSQTVDLVGNSTVEAEFDFANAIVTSSTITFSIEVTSGGTTFYDVGTAACTDVTQTNSTTPPLDVFRRDRVGVQIYAASGLAAATPVPTMSFYGLALTMLSLLFVAFRRLRVSAKRD